MQYNNENNLSIAIELGYSALQLTKLETDNTQETLNTIENVLSRIDLLAKEKDAASLRALSHWMTLNTEYSEKNKEKYQALLQNNSYTNWLITLAQLLRDFDQALLPVLHDSLTKPDWPISPSTPLLKSIAGWILETRVDNKDVEIESESAITEFNETDVTETTSPDLKTTQETASEDDFIGRHVFEEVDMDILEKEYSSEDADLLKKELPVHDDTLIIETDKTDILYHDLSDAEKNIDSEFIKDIEDESALNTSPDSALDTEIDIIEFTGNGNNQATSDINNLISEIAVETDIEDSLNTDFLLNENEEPILKNKNNTNNAPEEKSINIDESTNSDNKFELNDFSDEADDIVMSLSTISASSDNVFSETEKYIEEIQRLEMLAEISSYNSIKSLCDWCIANIDLFKQSQSDEAKIFIESNECWSWIELISACIVEPDEITHLSTLTTELSRDEWIIPLDAEKIQELLLFLRNPYNSSETNEENNDKIESTIEEDASTDNTNTQKEAVDNEEINISKEKNENTSGLSLNWDEDTHPELLEVYLQETPEQIKEVASLIHKLSLGKTTKEERKTASRMAHTIKGGSAVVGIDALSELAYKFEHILDHSVNNELASDKTDLLVEASKCLDELFNAVQNQSKEPESFALILNELTKYSETLEDDDLPLELPTVDLPDFITKQNKDSINLDKKESGNKNKAQSSSKSDEPTNDNSTKDAKKLEEINIDDTGEHTSFGPVSKLSNPDDINAFNTEVDDIVMTLASISAITDKPYTNINEFQAELQRLDMLSEISGFPEIYKLSQWCQQNLSEFVKKQSKQSEQFIKSGECWTWIELVSACLMESEEITHMSALSTELMRDDWLIPIPEENLQSLLLSLKEIETKEETKKESKTEEKVIKAKKVPTKTKSKVKPTPRKRKVKAKSSSSKPTSKRKTKTNKETKTATKSPAESNRKTSRRKTVKPKVVKKATPVEIISWDEDIHPELLAIYFQETPDQIAEVAQLLNLISKGKAKKEDLQLASRIAHTIKGASGVVGIDSLVELTHRLEDILDYSITNKLPKDTSTFMSEASDCLESLFESIQEKKDAPDELTSVLKELTSHVESLQDQDNSDDKKTVKQQKSKAKTSKTSTSRRKTAKTSTKSKPRKKAAKATTKRKPTRKIAKPTKSSKTLAQANPQSILGYEDDDNQLEQASNKFVPVTETHIRVRVDVIDRLLNLAGELVTTSAQVSDQLQKTLITGKEIKLHDIRVHKMLEELSNTISKQEKEQSSLLSSIQSSEFDTLEMDTYNELHSVTGLLTESILDSEEVENNINKQLNNLNNDLRSLDKLNKELSDVILSSRMVSINTLVPRLERIVRQTCRKTKKQAILNVTGNDINIDTDILNGLVDPLLHLLRNAVDHGIETTRIRNTKKKSKEGQIDLNFKREGNNILMTLKDDGAGINPDIIYQSAVKKGLITPDAEFSKSEILKLILHPGFSTQSKVSDISGRGVGMDVVNTAVEKLKGNLIIDSDIDKGTTIDLKIPLTLVTSTTLLVSVSGNPVAIPSSSIDQLYYLTPEDVISRKNEHYIKYKNEELEIISLSHLLDWPTKGIDFLESHTLLIIKNENNAYAIHVDEIIYSREVVIKQLAPWIDASKGITGACHLNDGAVAPVLNLPQILSHTDIKSKTVTPTQKAKDETNKSQNTPQILVVDDSLSNRKALSLIIEQTEYDVITAVDGLDALQIMNDKPINMVFTDLEMPRMNGLEFTQAIRAWDDKKDIPVIMITSRTTSKHRELAKKAGVNDYLTKPVVTETLLESMQTWLKQVETAESQ